MPTLSGSGILPDYESAAGERKIHVAERHELAEFPHTRAMLSWQT